MEELERRIKSGEIKTLADVVHYIDSKHLDAEVTSRIEALTKRLEAEKTTRVQVRFEIAEQMKLELTEIRNRVRVLENAPATLQRQVECLEANRKEAKISIDARFLVMNESHDSEASDMRLRIYALEKQEKESAQIVRQLRDRIVGFERERADTHDCGQVSIARAAHTRIDGLSGMQSKRDARVLTDRVNNLTDHIAGLISDNRRLKRLEAIVLSVIDEESLVEEKSQLGVHFANIARDIQALYKRSARTDERVTAYQATNKQQLKKLRGQFKNLLLRISKIKVTPQWSVDRINHELVHLRKTMDERVLSARKASFAEITRQCSSLRSRMDRVEELTLEHWTRWAVWDHWLARLWPWQKKQ